MMNDGFMSCLQEDVQLMVDIGLDAYRFSISWSRLIPNGRGPVNMKGLQYYNNLIDELIRNGIQPHVTLHHADLPLALEDERDFTSYADVCFREFGDRVLHWTTLNEGNVFVLGGYDLGFQPPRRCSATLPLNCSKGNSSTKPYMAAHNILLAHAAVAKLYKKKYQDKQHGLIGLNLFNYWFVPLTNTTEDIIAAQRANDFYVGWFMHPLVYGDYPSLMKKTAGSRMPAFTNIESNQVKGSFDFIGLNYYLTMYVKDQPSSLEMEQRDVVADMAIELMRGYDLGVLPPRRCSLPFNCSKGNSSTEPYMAVHNILLAHAAVARLYKKKYQDKQQGFIGINLLNNWFLPLTNTTEDKIAVQRANDIYLGWFMHPLVYGDYPSSIKKNAGSRLPAFTNRQSKRVKGQRMRCNSSLEDQRMVKSLNAYIGSVLEAIRSGSDTRGYFTWSILDVFELQDGYESSFGLYYVDLDGPDLTRYPKLSAK
ncbi:Glycoside hydrolase family 1 - like 10 [Theobroma cacao]|nr:Glycoside hydrolase family 1 - like 10 [Theobroma cacao]